MRGLIGLYDTYLAANDYTVDLTLVDPRQNFFFTVADNTILFDDPQQDSQYFFLPYVRAIYVVPHRRGKGLQQRLLEEMVAISDEWSYC